MTGKYIHDTGVKLTRVGVAVRDGVSVRVGVAVAVDVAVRVAVEVGGDVRVGVGVGPPVKRRMTIPPRRSAT